MIVTTSIDGPGSHPARHGGPLVCSVDIEWTKNYRVPNGNRAFCYSAVWLPLPPEPTSGEDLQWDYTSVYVDAEDEAPALVDAAAADLTAAMEQADLLVGHQLSSDLAVLAANGDPAPEALATARAAWHARTAAPASSSTPASTPARSSPGAPGASSTSAPNSASTSPNPSWEASR